MILVYTMYAYCMKNIVDKDCGMKYMSSVVVYFILFKMECNVQ